MRNWAVLLGSIHVGLDVRITIPYVHTYLIHTLPFSVTYTTNSDNNNNFIIYYVSICQ